ncbi:5-(carboxyamino)imidazole ribonucleotide synthase [Mitsuaria sp. PDC51]|jgi:5-(carboxyamino)imidazole ribonucleotide synthase|uniref:5-(carboxyamino)imidazole ribonucleotide synthase n=1 Tax=Mitsuaria sp. PDC51 TaxID=1881035 RepID=UPI0008E6C995|nr:5-(carboxyamino)imidazole ribonucleotide synthase [Mitsuaria sp. PDC51]SFR91075.1 5-(carboxyamino)imidazole ribonucleotide synthase [Mitsuaria sp. PDC51]
MPLLPGAATLGVLGGGQLGRMFVHAAQALGYRCVVLDPDAASPAGAVAQDHLKADYLDAAALEELARRCDAITTEFENVPARALEQLARTRVVAPGASAVAICQDRAREKAHFDASGVACAPYAVLRAPADLAAVPDALLPGILKTARLGYDGKGQRRVADRAQLAAAFDELGRVDCVLEQMLPLALELSVLVVRGAGGEVVTYPVQQNLHRDGILAVTEVPAPDVDAALQAQARRSAAAIATGMGYVGVLCVEFFVLKDGRLVVNEMAPRPHNSGHYTMNACDLSQFEMQVRAMAGLPLREPRLHSPVVMLNLLGDLWFDATGRERAPDWAGVLALPGAELHLYGKAQARPGRKMGHLNVIGATAEEAREHARRACALLGLPDTW